MTQGASRVPNPSISYDTTVIGVPKAAHTRVGRLWSSSYGVHVYGRGQLIVGLQTQEVLNSPASLLYFDRVRLYIPASVTYEFVELPDWFPQSPPYDECLAPLYLPELTEKVDTLSLSTDALDEKIQSISEGLNQKIDSLRQLILSLGESIAQNGQGITNNFDAIKAINNEKIEARHDARMQQILDGQAEFTQTLIDEIQLADETPVELVEDQFNQLNEAAQFDTSELQSAIINKISETEQALISHIDLRRDEVSSLIDSTFQDLMASQVKGFQNLLIHDDKNTQLIIVAINNLTGLQNLAPSPQILNDLIAGQAGIGQSLADAFKHQNEIIFSDLRDAIIENLTETQTEIESAIAKLPPAIATAVCTADCMPGKSDVKDIKNILCEEVSINWSVTKCNAGIQDILFTMKVDSMPKIDAIISALALLGETADIHAQKTCDIEPVAGVPEWWATRVGTNRPQLVVFFADKTPDGRWGLGRWSLAIPHYSGGPNLLPDFSSYTRGSNYGRLTLSDNSKLVVNAINESEAERVIASIKGYIEPSFLIDSMESYGQRKGQNIGVVKVWPKYAYFYATGQKNLKPDWKIDWT